MPMSIDIIRTQFHALRELSLTLSNEMYNYNSQSEMDRKIVFEILYSMEEMIKVFRRSLE